MEKIGLALEWFPNVDHIPILSGMNEGFFYNEDLELHVMTPVNHEAGIELASVGKLDFALTEPIHIPSARAKGLSIVAIGKYFETGFGIMTVGRDINNLKDLRGKKIAVSLQTHANLIVKFTDYGVPSYGYLVFVTSERSIRDRKEIISKFLRAIKNSIKFTLNNPQESLESFLAALPVLNNELNRRIYSATLSCYRDDTSLNLEEWDRLAKFANTNGLTDVGSKQINGREMIADYNGLI